MTGTDDNHEALKLFATKLGERIVKNSDEILRSNGLNETRFSVGVLVKPAVFQIVISCNEFIYNVPEMNIFEHFKGSKWETEITEFVDSYARFLAWDYLKYCGIEAKFEEQKT